MSCVNNNYSTGVSERIRAFEENPEAHTLFLSESGLSALPPGLFNRPAFVERLITLDLRGNQISTLPTEIGSLVVLQELFLRENQLTTLPTEIGSLLALRDLQLCKNPLTMLPTEIGSLLTLQRLSLRENQLTTLPTEIGSLLALKNLQLYSNQLTMLPTEIGSLSALQFLSPINNRLTMLPTEIGSLLALKYLMLNNNPLTMLPAEIMSLPSSCEVSLLACPFSLTARCKIKEATAAAGYQGPKIIHLQPTPIEFRQYVIDVVKMQCLAILAGTESRSLKS